ncbi:Secreted beta-glucosidase sun1 [Clydaea vesicula]|uniref:Secreted beta-glucosidase sun1 n=1 Tax=Clydaea vesicula TaxID=447962 RepID=A0AAD5Y1Y1_9FUNG|nr:Secreted beta-glucosidase sun1 [Clydaea vesicula]
MNTDSNKNLEKTRAGTPKSSRNSNLFNNAEVPTRSSKRLREKREASVSTNGNFSDRSSVDSVNKGSVTPTQKVRRVNFIGSESNEEFTGYSGFNEPLEQENVDRSFNYVFNDYPATPKAISYLKRFQEKFSDFISPKKIDLQISDDHSDDDDINEHVAEENIFLQGRDDEINNMELEVEDGADTEFEVVELNEDDFKNVAWYRNLEKKAAHIGNIDWYKNLEEKTPLLKIYDERIEKLRYTVSSNYNNIIGKIKSLQVESTDKDKYKVDLDIDPTLLESINSELKKHFEANNLKVDALKQMILSEKESIHDILSQLKEYDVKINPEAVFQLKEELNDLMEITTLEHSVTTKNIDQKFENIESKLNELSQNVKVSEKKNQHLSDYLSNPEDQDLLRSYLNNYLEELLPVYLPKTAKSFHEEQDNKENFNKEEYIESLIEKKMEKALDSISTIQEKISAFKEDVFDERFENIILNQRDALNSANIRLKNDFLKEIHSIKEEIDSSLNKLEKEQRKFEDTIKLDVKNTVSNFHYILTEYKKEISSQEEEFVKAKSLGENEFRNNAAEFIKKFYNEHNVHKPDSLGRLDYALETGGGKLLDILTSKSYCHKSTFLGCDVDYRPPRTILQRDVSLGRCWPMKGNSGYFGIMLSRKITPTSITIEHVAKQLNFKNNFKSAPKNFKVYAVYHKLTDSNEGDYIKENINGVDYFLAPLITSDNKFYDINKKNDGTELVFGRSEIQSFEVENKLEGVEKVFVKIESNWGNDDYTCIYRVRVHGEENQELIY